MKCLKMVMLLAAALLLGSSLYACNGASNVNTVSQNVKKGADVATEFAKVAILEKNPEKAYELTSTYFQKANSFESFKNFFQGMHPNGEPTEIHATLYEPAGEFLDTGQQKMFIYLEGSNGDKQYYYRVGLLYTDTSNYKVAEFVRMWEPAMQTANRKPL